MKKTVFLFLSGMSAGGQEQRVSRLSSMLCARYNLYIVLFDDTEVNYPVFGTILSMHCNDFNKRSFFSRIKKGLFRCIWLRRLIGQYHPIACMSFGGGPNLVNLLCRRHGTKVVTSICGYVTAESIIQKKWMQRLYTRADQVACVSKGIKDSLQKEVPALACKLVVLYSGYDCAQISSMAKEKCPNSFLPDEGLRIISVGTLRPEKGYWHLIKAFSILKRDYPDIYLSIVGPDYMENGKNLKRLADILKLKDHVRFEGWQNNPYVFTGNSDIYVLSSVREGFPNALIEAMACGKPVVAADCLTGPREILSKLPWDTVAKEIEQAEYGILVPKLDTREDYTGNITPEEELLAEAIRLLLENPVLREEYGHRAKKRAEEFSYQKCTEQVIKILEGNSE